MKFDTTKETEFYSKPFKFSYSSLNKLLYAPYLFYKDYILGDRELKTDKHLIEGRLIHCLLFEPENLKEKFNISPSKVPTDSVKNVLIKLKSFKVQQSDFLSLDSEWKNLILEALKIENLYQSLKEDEKRLEKIMTSENKVYWDFLSSTVLDTIDSDTLAKCQEQVDIIKNNGQVMSLLSDKQTDFELDPLQVYKEKALDYAIPSKPFGLKGIVDYYKIDGLSKTVTICDLKTTSKTIVDFPESIEFYNYWLQAAMYSKLVYENLKPEEKENYKINFKFIVIDKYNQVYVFGVSENTMANWMDKFSIVLEQAQYHYENRKYNLPFEFLTKTIIL